MLAGAADADGAPEAIEATVVELPSPRQPSLPVPIAVPAEPSDHHGQGG